MLVLYYSQTGNTKMVAEEIAKHLNADIEEITMVNPYDTSFQATIERCKEEMAQGITPEINPVKSDPTQYDIIFLGYPVWFGTYAPPVTTWLSCVDLSGKKLVPFCTFGSGGLDSSVKDLKAKLPKAEILPGYGVRAARLEAMPKEVERFLKEGGYIDGEYARYDDFFEAHPVSEAEAAIFDAAVGTYPMIQAKAVTAASRLIEGGTEYLFTAVDKPREGMPAMPGAPEMKVYVVALDGQAPEFTQVVR